MMCLNLCLKIYYLKCVGISENILSEVLTKIHIAQFLFITINNNLCTEVFLCLTIKIKFHL